MKRKSDDSGITSSESSNSTLRPGETRRTSTPREVLVEEIRPSTSRVPIRILILGPSRFGKTYTIHDFCGGIEEPMAYGPYNATKRTITHRLKFEGREFELIDTPGFDNISMSDVEAFVEIAECLLNPKRIQKGITGVIYVHRAGNTLYSRSLLRNFRVLTNLFLGNAGIHRLTFLVTQNETQAIDHEKIVDEMRARGSVFSAAFSAGATIAPSPNRGGFAATLRSYLSQKPMMLPIQLNESYQSHPTFVAEVEKELGYCELKSVQLLLDNQEQELEERYEQRLVGQREVEAQIYQQLQQSQLEYSSLRSQLQHHENIEQSEVVQALHDLNRMIEDIGRAISAYLSDEYAPKTFRKDLADVTTLDARDLRSLKSLVGHETGKSSFVISSWGCPMQIEAFLDFVIRNKICLHLCQDIFTPFHPDISPSLNRVLMATFKGIQEQEPQSLAGKWRSETFQHISDPKRPHLTIGQLVEACFNKLMDDAIVPLTRYVFGKDITMKEAHRRLLCDVIQKAWDWNSILKKDVIMLGEFSLIAHPHYARFNAESMEEFEADPRHTPPVKILGTLALGLKSRRAMGAGNPVQETMICKPTVLTKNVYS